MAGETKTSSEKDLSGTNAASTSAASSNPASSKQKSQHTSMPKDAEVMISILKDMGVNEFEPRVVNQLLEFSYRYATNVLEEAREISAHAKKKAIDVDDVKLAVQMYAEQNMTQPPPRDILLDLARTKNAVPLPVPKPTCGLRLPPERHCLTACNYRLKSRSKRPPPGFGGGLKTGGPSASAKPLLVMPTQQPGKPLYTLELQAPAQTASYGDASESKRFKLSMNP